MKGVNGGEEGWGLVLVGQRALLLGGQASGVEGQCLILGCTGQLGKDSSLHVPYC